MARLFSIGKAFKVIAILVGTITLLFGIAIAWVLFSFSVCEYPWILPESTWTFTINPARDTLLVANLCPGTNSITSAVRLRIQGTLDDTAKIELLADPSRPHLTQAELQTASGFVSIYGDTVNVLSHWRDLYVKTITVDYRHYKARKGNLVIQVELPTKQRPYSEDSVTVKW